MCKRMPVTDCGKFCRLLKRLTLDSGYMALLRKLVKPLFSSPEMQKARRDLSFRAHISAMLSAS